MGDSLIRLKVIVDDAIEISNELNRRKVFVFDTTNYPTVADVRYSIIKKLGISDSLIQEKIHFWVDDFYVSPTQSNDEVHVKIIESNRRKRNPRGRQIAELADDTKKKTVRADSTLDQQPVQISSKNRRNKIVSTASKKREKECLDSAIEVQAVVPLIPVVRPPPPPRPPPPSHPPPTKLLQLPVPNENMALITAPITMSSKVGPSFNGRSVDNRPSWIQSTDPIRNSIGNNRSIHNKPAKLESSSIQLVGQDGANRAGRQPFVPPSTRSPSLNEKTSIAAALDASYAACPVLGSLETVQVGDEIAYQTLSLCTQTCQPVVSEDYTLCRVQSVRSSCDYPPRDSSPHHGLGETLAAMAGDCDIVAVISRRDAGNESSKDAPYSSSSSSSSQDAARGHCLFLSWSDLVGVRLVARQSAELPASGPTGPAGCASVEDLLRQKGGGSLPHKVASLPTTAVAARTSTANCSSNKLASVSESQRSSGSPGAGAGPAAAATTESTSAATAPASMPTGTRVQAAAHAIKSSATVCDPKLTEISSTRISAITTAGTKPSRTKIAKAPIERVVRKNGKGRYSVGSVLARVRMEMNSNNPSAPASAQTTESASLATAQGGIAIGSVSAQEVTNSVSVVGDGSNHCADATSLDLQATAFESEAAMNVVYESHQSMDVQQATSISVVGEGNGEVHLTSEELPQMSGSGLPHGLRPDEVEQLSDVDDGEVDVLADFYDDLLRKRIDIPQS